MAIESQTVRERPFGLSAEGVASNASKSPDTAAITHKKKRLIRFLQPAKSLQSESGSLRIEGPRRANGEWCRAKRGTQALKKNAPNSKP